ncbi:MAG TPA: alkaline phosphatase family protein [Bacillota bacterium]|nr:alkaline phosphatase family protein [Bacillota bacterium]
MPKIVFPDYNHSLLNLTNSILKNYGVKTEYNSLETVDELLREGKYRNVVLYLVDAMGIEILRKHKNEAKFLLSKNIDELTTVFPSTTVAATTTAITGLPPVNTAWIGWQQYVAEEDKNVIFFLNQDYYNEEHKFNYNVSEKYAQIKKIYERIENYNPNVMTHEVFPEFRVKEHKTILDQVNTVLQISKNGKTNFIYAYWDKLDTYLHEYGTQSDIVKNHVDEIDKAMQVLSNNLSEDSVVIITADHGQVDVEGINLWEYEDITSLLKHQPSIEARATAFYIKDNGHQEFEKLFNKHFKDKFVLYKSSDLINTGIFGKGEKSPRTEGFLGDFFSIAIDIYSFRLQNAGHIHKATHAGLLKDEMMIPLIILNKKAL